MAKTCTEGPQMRDHFVKEALRACRLAREAATACAELVRTDSSELHERVARAEKDLDVIDHDLDEQISLCVINADAETAREMLACVKFAVDLERIGDLLASVSAQSRAMPKGADPEGRQHLSAMAKVLERMLQDVESAFEKRDVKPALQVMRADTELDRMRNLMIFRYAEQQKAASSDNLRVMFMAQSLERAGDHAKNLTEEVIHYITGHSVRHAMLPPGKKSWEEMYIDWMRAQANA